MTLTYCDQQLQHQDSNFPNNDEFDIAQGLMVHNHGHPQQPYQQYGFQQNPGEAQRQNNFPPDVYPIQARYQGYNQHYAPNPYQHFIANPSPPSACPPLSNLSSPISKPFTIPQPISMHQPPTINQLVTLPQLPVIPQTTTIPQQAIISHQITIPHTATISHLTTVPQSLTIPKPAGISKPLVPTSKHPMPPCGSIRKRKKFSKPQVDALLQKFSECDTLYGVARDHFAMQLGLKSEQVRTWFQNQRQKTKKAAKRF